MAHNHSHTITSSNEINRSFMIGIALNVSYVIVEIIYGFRNNSTSLLSDAAHNVGDVSGLLLAFLAFKLQTIKPSKIFSYGLKKGSIVTSFINSILWWVLKIAFFTFDLKKSQKPFHDLLKSAQIYYYF